MSILDKIKKRISDSSKTLTDEFYLGQDKKSRVRFISDFELAEEFVWHDKYKESINMPCLKAYNKECPACPDGDDKKEIRTRTIYVWTVYNHDLDKKQLFKFPATNFTPVPALVAMYEAYGTLCDRDFVISRTGTGFDIAYNVVPMDKSKPKFKNNVAFTKKDILKKWAKIYNLKEIAKNGLPSAKGSKKAESDEDLKDEFGLDSDDIE